MKKHLLFWCCSFLSVSSLSAQEVVASSGDSYTSPSASLDVTVGEVVINTVTNGSTTLTQGYQQSSFNFVSVQDYKPDYSITMFPNPADDAVTLIASDFAGVHFNLYDAKGSLLMDSELLSTESTIDVNHIPKGSYYLHLTRNGDMLKTFTLIKN